MPKITVSYNILVSVWIIYNHMIMIINKCNIGSGSIVLKFWFWMAEGLEVFHFLGKYLSTWFDTLASSNYHLSRST